MNVGNVREDVQIGTLALYAEDMFTVNGPGVLEPPLDPRFGADWALRGYLTGAPAALMRGPVPIGGKRVYFGVVVESVSQPGVFCIAVRGTASPVEWLKDSEFALRSYSGPGRVETGFRDVYDSLLFRKPGGIDAPLLSSIMSIIGTVVGIQVSIVVVGHSLGGAVATYLAADLADPQRLSNRVRARLFESPKPGDAAFVEFAAQRVPDHVAYSYELDLVPRLPAGLGYQRMPSTQDIFPPAAEVRVECDLDCNHHLLCILAMLDSSVLTRFQPIPQDKDFLACIKSRLGIAAAA